MKGARSHRNLLAGVALLAVATVAQGQQGALDRVHYKDALREDLEVILQTLDQAHPDPYRYHGRQEVVKLQEAIIADLDPGLTAEQFIRETLPIFRAVGDAGTFLALPKALDAAYESDLPLIPLKVAVIDGHLYLDEELKGFRSLPPGCEILSINGHGTEELLERMRGLMVADGKNRTLLDRRIEQDFPRLYRRAFGEARRFEVVYVEADASRASQEVMAMTKEQMHQTYRRKGVALKPWRFQELPAISTGWLTLATLEREELEEARVVPDRFLNDVARVLRRSQFRNLVIDVRGAGGSDVGMAEQVFALIAQERFRVVSGMSIRSGEIPGSYRYAKPNPEFFAAIGGMYQPELNGRRELKANDPRLLMVPPSAKAFEGKVYVVANGLTTGAGAAFMMMAKRTGRARTVGEEVGSNSTSFCGGRTLEVTLPHTGCVLHVPLTRYVPEGTGDGPADRGEMPIYPVRQRIEDLAEGGDTVRRSLLMLIAEMQ